MLIQNFLNGTGLYDTNIALTIMYPDLNEFINTSDWHKMIDENFKVNHIEGGVLICNRNREVILVKEDELHLITNFITDGRKRLIIIFHESKKISEETRSFLTQHKVPLLDFILPKPDNDYAKSLTKTSSFINYLKKSYSSQQSKFWYELVVKIIVDAIVSYIKL